MAHKEPCKEGGSIGGCHYHYWNNGPHHSRDVPHDPLEKSAPLNLYFTLEYMDGLAEAISSRSEYVGLVFKSDRPAFQR